MKRKILALVLTFAMVVSMVPFAFAEEADTDGSEGIDQTETVLAAEGDYVAQIGDQGYATLAAAVEAAASGAVIQMLTDTDISADKVTIPKGESLVLDLNGKKIKAANNGSITVLGALTICDTSEGAIGQIYSETPYNGGTYSSGVIQVDGEDSLLTMESGNIYTVIANNPASNGQFGVFLSDGADFTMTGGKIESGWYAVSGNGNNKTQNTQINISGGELISTADYAVYLPQSGTTSITGGTIYGAAGGICLQRGSLNITGNALITSKGTGDTGEWGDGTGTLGNAALNIAAEYGDCSVNINAGVFTAEGDAVIIASGTSYGIDYMITGGSFSSKLSDNYLPAGYTCELNEETNKYEVQQVADGAMVVEPGNDGSGNASATLDGIYKGEGTTIEDNTSGSGESSTGDTGVAESTGAVTVDLTTEGASGTGSASLTVTPAAAASLANNNAPSLTVQTDVGSVKLDAEALDKVGGTRGNVVISITKNSNGDGVSEAAASYTVEVKSGGDDLLPEGDNDNGDITITIPCPESVTTPIVYYIKNGIPYQRMDDVELIDEGNNITFTTTHLSQYAVYSEEPAVDYEATVTTATGTTPYNTLAEAISAAQDGDTVTLEKDAESTAITIDEGITLDLDGNTLTLIRGEEATFSSVGLFFTSGNSTLTNGTIVDGRVYVNTGGSGYTVAGNLIMACVTGTDTSLTTSDVTMQTYYPHPNVGGFSYIMYVQNGASLTTGSGTKLVDQAHQAFPNVETNGGIGIVVLGSDGEATSLTIKDGTEIETYAYAISGNGSSDNTKITVEGGTITSTNGNAVYHPQFGDLTIQGGTFTGTSGVQFCGAGNLTISDGKFIATADYSQFPEKPSDQNDGSAEDGAALSIISRGSGYQDGNQKINVTISGGTFTSQNNAAVTVYRLAQLVDDNWVTNDLTSVTNYLEKLIITGGDFFGGDQKGALEIDNKAGDVVAVSGGSYSSSVAKYVIDALNAELKKSSGATPYSYYTDVEEALEHASSGDEITDLTPESGGSSEPVKVVTVAYNNGGHGSAPESETVTIGTKTELPEMVNVDGYIFAGWAYGDTTYQSGAEITVDKDMTFTAVWKATITPTAVRYVVQHYLEGRWGYNLVKTEYFTGEIGDTVTAQPEDFPGYRYNWRISTASGTLTAIDGPEDIVTLKLYYDERDYVTPSDPGYDIEVSGTENGTIVVSGSAMEGSSVTITVRPDEGYELAELAVYDENGNELRLTSAGTNRYSFVMPDSEVTVYAEFQLIKEEEEEITVPFTDVSEGSWYYDAVAYVYENGLMNGVGDNEFDPQGTATRAMLATILWRLEGEPVVNYLMTYDDVDPAAWYGEAVRWATSEGVVTGYGDEAFGPGDAITREQLAVMLYRYAGEPDADRSVLAPYGDSMEVSGWATDAMAWAVENGIVEGDGSNLDPQSNATRAQIAAILMRFIENVVK